jgi:hypothetical protein
MQHSVAALFTQQNKLAVSNLVAYNKSYHFKNILIIIPVVKRSRYIGSPLPLLCFVNKAKQHSCIDIYEGCGIRLLISSLNQDFVLI